MVISWSNHLNVCKILPYNEFAMDVWYVSSVNLKFKVIQSSKCLFLSILWIFFDILTFTWPWIFCLKILYIFLSLANNLSVALYQNNWATSTRNPMIHIHINKNLWKLLIHFPAFLFFKCHNLFNQVGPDNKITHVRCSKPPYIIQNQISVFVLTLSKIVWSVSNQMCTLLYLFLPENHPIFKNSRKNSKNWPKAKPFKIYRRKWF